MQNIRLTLDKKKSFQAWVGTILESAKKCSGDIVGRHLVGAVVARRFKDMTIPNHPAHAADRQTERVGDFAVSKLAYHVTAAPSMDVLRKCADNLRLGLQPILLVPCDQKPRARVLAEEVGVDKNVVITSIEDFVALNIIELATEENKDFFTILQEIVEIYNRRLAEVETDLSLRIEVH